MNVFEGPCKSIVKNKKKSVSAKSQSVFVIYSSVVHHHIASISTTYVLFYNSSPLHSNTTLHIVKMTYKIMVPTYLPFFFVFWATILLSLYIFISFLCPLAGKKKLTFRQNIEMKYSLVTRNT